MSLILLIITCVLAGMPIGLWIGFDLGKRYAYQKMYNQGIDYVGEEAKKGVLRDGYETN